MCSASWKTHYGSVCKVSIFACLIDWYRSGTRMRRVPFPSRPTTDQFARSPYLIALLIAGSGTRMRRVPFPSRPTTDQSARSPLIDCLIDL